MVNHQRDVQVIKGRKYLVFAYWIGMIWTISGIVTIVFSNSIVLSGFTTFLGIPPFTIKSPLATALIIFPGTIILGVVSCVIHKKNKKPRSELVYYLLLTAVLGTVFIIMTLVVLKLLSHN